jgi:uncharacterized Zn finger protein
MGYYDYYGWKPYVSVAERRRKAEREMQKLRKKGHPVSPVVIEGRSIARTYWGKAWCDNLERYSDFSNRVPRGRTYVRNGSVVDLQIAPGEVSALVSGSDIYKVAVKVAAVPKARWTSICTDCAGAIDSLVELLQGRFSNGVMERICQRKTGLFPAPAEIQFSCSCPDWASMCKHVAAVLYGTGARLDEQPELLFKLRKIDEKDLIAKAGEGLPLSKKGPAEEKVLAADGLSELFGLEMGTSADEPKSEVSQTPAKPARARRAVKAAPRPRDADAPAKPRGRQPLATTKKKAPKAKTKPKARAKKRKTPERGGRAPRAAPAASTTTAKRTRDG